MFIPSPNLNKKNHLVIGGGYISQYHIRASLANNYNIILVEIDAQKRSYLKYLFPEITTYKSINEMYNIIDTKNINLLSILVPPKFRTSIYEDLKDLNCKVLIEKPITNACINKFRNMNSFVCLNQAYNKSGTLIHQSKLNISDIDSVISTRPDPKQLLRQSTINEYLIDYLPHTLTSLHLAYSKYSPKIIIEEVTSTKIAGVFNTRSVQIRFSLKIGNEGFDTIINCGANQYSYDNGLINLNSNFQSIRRNLSMINSVIKCHWGYSTMYRLYKEIYYYEQKKRNLDIIEKLRLSNCKYLALENYE